MSQTSTASTHAQRALFSLRQRILSGAIQGGTRLFEVALAEELQISRTPVRAALSQLAEEGLLERGQSGGFTVRSFALAEVVDTIELRGVLEGTAARFAAERGADPDLLTKIEFLLADLDACVFVKTEEIDISRYAMLNTQFHVLLSRLCGSAVLQREIERVTRLPFASPSAFLADDLKIDRFRRTLIPAQEQHRSIVEAIRAREGARAESIAREHARAARRNVEFLFAADPKQRIGVSSLALIAS
ncbi:GntR family transcriptional regulator [Thioclava sp. FR2]|uniref:GntR family transcriptional regulator n=1 Tax=Thioclava sp. FR2 TaxID=3445780 RepID=UPI003EBD0BA1